MKQKVVTVSLKDPADKVVQYMRYHHIGCVIVADKTAYPAGIITESDIISALDKSGRDFFGLSACDLMSSPVLCVPPDQNLEEIAVLMATSRIRRVPVVENGVLKGLVSYRDLTDDLRKNYYYLDEIIEDKANKDPLTGLYNKNYGLDQLNYQFELSRRVKTPMAAFMFDIDHFKNVNDTYGHLAGDRVLKTAAHIIKDCSRNVDIVSRYGGEEFLIAGFVADGDSAMILPERIRKNFEKTEFYFEGDAIHVTISCGVAVWADKYDNATELLKAADTALYQAKNSGRNRVIKAA